MVSRILAEKSFITTPIFYVNSAPHIGHLYTAVLADAAHRWFQLQSRCSHECILSTGTDEHGLKIQQAASDSNISPQLLCDKVSQKFKNQLWELGFIYESKYEGWYSVPDEVFVSDSGIVDGDEQGTKNSKESGHKLQWSSETNFMFKLSTFQERLLQWVTTSPYPIIPNSARYQVINWIMSGVNDISISRPSSRLYWGIPVPNRNDQTIYVWLDALVNYLTVSNYPNKDHLWPASCHIIGKDIMRFHCIYWPAFLMALDLKLPKKIVVHSHWTIDKNKMSKSVGNVVDPFTRLETYGSDALRYYLLKESRLHQDGDFSDDRIISLLYSDLADTLGNLLSRITSQKLYPLGVQVSYDASTVYSMKDKDDELFLHCLKSLPQTVSEYYNNYDFCSGINAIMESLHKANQFISRHKPWSLVSNPNNYSHLEAVLGIAIETVRLSAVLLSPIMPNTCPDILKRLAIDPTQINEQALQCLINSDDSATTVRNPIFNESPLFSKT